MNSALTLSIVIPVYNEENYLKACLDAIAVQTVRPHEVIVVDNNSTDRSVEIAKSYDFVKLVTEKRQGRGFARSAGFDAASSDILGRIDADSILAPDWAERVLNDFKDQTVYGVTGLGQTNLIFGINSFYITFWSRVYFWTSHALFQANTMWGANMAIRRSAWMEARAHTCPDDQLVHEDQDLSLVMLGQGRAIVQDNKLLIKTAGRSYLYWPKFWEYLKRTFKTKQYHIDKHTLADNSPLRINALILLPGAIVGWFFSGIFIVYSLLSWPIFALIKRFNKKWKQLLR